MLKKRLSILFISLAFLTLVGAGCFNSQQATNNNGQVKGAQVAQNVAQVKVTLVVNTGEKKESYDMTSLPDAKVVDVLKAASAQYNFALEIKDSAYGPFVQSIAGKAGENGKFWMYYVNGSQAMVGVGEQKITEGDIIEFRFE